MKIRGYTFFEKAASETPKPSARREVVKIGHTSKTKHQEDKGLLSSGSTWTDKLPHPKNMDDYDDLNRDSEVGTAINVLSNMTVGSGYYTEMGEDDDPNHANKKMIDDWAETVELDELAAQIERIRLGKGFCPVEIMKDYKLKILPPETFYIWRDAKGKVEKYTQEMNLQTMATWQGAEIDSIILFIRHEDPLHPYGHAIVDNIVDNIHVRRQVNEDIPDVIHKYAWPYRVWESDTKEIGDVIYTAATSRNVDEDIFIDNVQKDQMRIHTETMDPRINFTEYVVHNDEQIAEALHAPLLIYLRNATEASATKMLEAIQLDIEGAQRYNKRRYENLFKRIVGDPTPKLVWGSPKSGLEDLTLDQLANTFKTGALNFEQVQDLMQKLGLPIKIAPPQDQPIPPQQGVVPGQVPGIPMQPAQIPPNLQTQLQTLEHYYRNEKITLREALDEGNQAIRATVELMKEASVKAIEKAGGPSAPLPATSEQWYSDLHNSIFSEYKNRLIPTRAPAGSDVGRVFEVKVVA